MSDRLSALLTWATSCRTENTPQWMEQFAERINAVLEDEGEEGGWRFDERSGTLVQERQSDERN